MRYEYSDQIPSEVIHSTSPGNKHKARGGWWTGVISDLEIAARDEISMDENLKQEIDEFIAKVKAMQFGDNTPVSLRTAAEIAWANTFIDLVLAATGYADTPLDLSDLNR